MTTDSEDGLVTVASGAGLVFVGNVAKFVILFILQIVMARLLNVDSYGTAVIASVVINIGATIGTLGLDSGLVRALPYYEDDVGKARGVVRSGLATSVLMSAVIGGAVFLTAPLIATEVFDEPTLVTLLRIAAIGIPFSALINTSIAIARGARDAKTQTIVRQLIDPSLRIVLITVLILAGYGAAGALGGEVLSIIISGVVAVIIAARVLPFSVRGRSQRMYSTIVLFSLPLMFSSSMYFVISNTDTFLIGVFLTSSSVGIYNVAFRLQDVGMLFFFPATFLLPPVLTRLFKNGERRRARRMYQLVTKWMVFFTLPLFIALFLFSNTIIRYSFGPEYVIGASALQVLMIPVMTTVLLGANGPALIALGHNRISLYVNVGAAIANILLNIALIPSIGIVGAAVASAAAFMFRDLLFTVLLYRWEGINPFSRPLLKPLAIALGLVTPSYFLFVSVSGTTIIDVAGFMAAFIAVYAVVIISAGGIEPEDGLLLSLVESKLGIRLTPLRRSVVRLQKYR